ncbi:MAG: right-handed parallel beta-helix repeat-containing protein [Dehalococcoidia bacterium]
MRVPRLALEYLSMALLGAAAIAGAIASVLPADAGAAPGDVDCSGGVTSIDAALILQLSAGRISTLPCPDAADVNNDGRTNAIDAQLVLQLGAGLIGAFPSCDITAPPAWAQDEIDAAGPGDTVCLTNGTYDRLFVYQKTGLTIVGVGAPTTTVIDDPDNHTCLLVIESHDITIENLRASNCDVQAGFAGDSTNVTFRRIETAGGPIGVQFQRSTGSIVDSNLHDHDDIGAIVQLDSSVTIQRTDVSHNTFGIIAQENATLRLLDSDVSDNSQGGVFTLHETGSTTIDGTRIVNNGLNVFAGVPGCADLPAGSSDPPQCFLDNPGAYVSDIDITVRDSSVRDSHGTGVVLFPGVNATLRNSSISGSGLTGLFAWGAHLTASGNDYANNVENAIECRAYPGPSAGDRGLCRLSFEHIHNSLPLGANSLGGGFVSEGGQFDLTDSTIENNWGIGVQVLHGGLGSVLRNVIRNNGGSAFCISGAGPVTLSGNQESGNRPGACLGHP